MSPNLGIFKRHLLVSRFSFRDFLTIFHMYIIQRIIEGSLEVKLPTIWTDGRAEMERVREEKKREDQRRERARRKKMQVCEKVEKSRFTAVFQWFVAPQGRKVGCGGSGAIWPERWKIARGCGGKHICKSKCTKHIMFGALLEFWCRKSARCCGAKHISKSSVKTWRVRSTLGSWDIEKVNAVLAQSTFRSQKC